MDSETIRKYNFSSLISHVYKPLVKRDHELFFVLAGKTII